MSVSNERNVGESTGTSVDVNCPSCQSKDIRFGRGSVFKIPFVPETPLLQYARSYHPQQFVCLACGHLGFALKDTDLKRLRQDMMQQDAAEE